MKEKGISFKSNKDKIVSDEFIHNYNILFCEICIDHINKWTHMYSGKEFTHILTNEEIKLLVRDMNRTDLFEVLKAEKGTCAETILSKFNLDKPPEEIIYKKEHILSLLSELEKDYYDRYSFNELQNLILEDRRVRLNNWVSTVINKPPEYFKNPKFINNVSIKDINNVASKYFTLMRTLPIKIRNEEEIQLKSIIIEHPILLKDKLSNHEINLKLEKLVNKNMFQVSSKESQNNNNISSNMLLMRNFNLEKLKNNSN
jgi:hypothetical protein